MQERLEETLRVAAALIYYCQKMGWPTGLVAGSGEGRLVIEASSGRGHLARLLRGLAGLDFQANYSLRRLINGEAARALPGTSLFLVACEATRDLVSTLSKGVGQVSLEVFPARASKPEVMPNLAGRSRHLLVHSPVFPEDGKAMGEARRGAGMHAGV